MFTIEDLVCRVFIKHSTYKVFNCKHVYVYNLKYPFLQIPPCQDISVKQAYSSTYMYL